MKTLLIPEFSLISFSNEDDKQVFVEGKLQEAGFSLNKKYTVRKGYKGSGFIFEQE